MRIISKEHDYYDRAMGQGQDESAKYLRVRTELTVAAPRLKTLMENISNSFHYDPVQVRRSWHVFEPFVIAFCGKLYRGIKAVRLVRMPSDSESLTREESVFYHWDDLKSYLDLHKVTVPKQPFYRGNTPFEKLAQHYLSSQGTSELSSFLLEHGIVILTCMEKNLRYFVNGAKVGQTYVRPDYRLTIDDNIGNLNFGQLFDAFSAYQEIDMYVSGTLASTLPPTVVLTEADRLNQHGFNKWSFRRPPSES